MKKGRNSLHEKQKYKKLSSLNTLERKNKKENEVDRSIEEWKNNSVFKKSENEESKENFS